MTAKIDERFTLWQRNVIDRYKDIPTEDIKRELAEKSFPCAVLVQNIEGDFNLGTIMRSANAFGINKFYYYGKKRFDPRGTVGVRHYMDVKFLSTIEDVATLKNFYDFIALENNVERKVCDIRDFSWQPNTLFVIGEENSGLTNEMIDLCGSCVSIPMQGSVRSFNAATAASIAFYDYYCKQTRR